MRRLDFFYIILGMYYFAYGSNMNYEQMRRICGRRFMVLDMAALPGFEFGVDQRGYVNIRPKAGAEVMGVLYDLEQQALDMLDEFEGYPEVFNRIEVQVKDSSGSQYDAWVYLEKPEEFGGNKIKAEHLKMIIAGAMENHLPEKWINHLTSFQW